MLGKLGLIAVTVILSCSAFAKFEQNKDITSYINQLIKQQKVVSIPAGTYKIDANKSIIPKNGSEIKLHSETKLTVIPTKHGSYRVFQIKNVENVKISGGSLAGDKYTHLGSVGEWGMGIEIRDSQNISISNMHIDKMWGDAIYVGTNGKNSTYNISINDVQMNDNRRQGITIISVSKLRANNIKATNTKGAKPSSGIDIEPNNGSMILKDIELKNIATSGNAGSGIQIGLSRYNNSTSPVSISISNHQDTKSQYGILLGAINSKALGSVRLDSLNYSSNSCFNSWSNNRFKVVVHGSASISKLKSCMGHLKNSNISFK